MTVIIPTYNRETVLEKSIRSVLNQTCGELEVIVVDDGSMDRTKEVVESVKDARVFYTYQKNSGACTARNRGAAMARGEYIAFHDSDDIWHPDKLEKQLKTLRETGADVVVCRMRRHAGGTREICYPKRVSEGFLSIRNDLFGIGTQTILARREVTESIAFRPELPRYQDLEWFIHALERFRIYCMEEVMVDYYVGGDSISKKPERIYEAFTLFLKYYPQLRMDSPALCMHIARDLLAGWYEMMHKNPSESAKFLHLACRFLFGNVK